MSARLFGSAAALSVVVFACAPDQPPVTTSCTSVRDCALGDVCDRATRACIPEPPDRFLGAFDCTVEVSGSPNRGVVELSEVLGRIDRDRWTLPGVFCLVDPEDDVFTLGLVTTTAGGAGMAFFTTITKAKTGRVEIKPAFGGGLDDAATMDDPDIGKVFGTSTGGHVEFSGPVTPGTRLTGYIDVTMLKAPRGEPRFGEPCPQGLAQCGDTHRDVGGASRCIQVVTTNPTPICTRSCRANGDCSAADGICSDGVCSKPCNTDADCTPPTRCFESNTPGDPKGCY